MGRLSLKKGIIIAAYTPVHTYYHVIHEKGLGSAEDPSVGLRIATVLDFQEKTFVSTSQANTGEDRGSISKFRFKKYELHAFGDGNHSSCSQIKSKRSQCFLVLHLHKVALV